MAEASLIERFYREAKATAALDHPNIVRCHDADKDDKLHYLVLEYVDGISMQQLVSQHGPLDPVRAAHYISQTAAGLQHAHEVGWVHRDIKPGNLLVDRQGVVKVLDLGLARILLDSRDQLTKQLDDKAVLGTADYLAPEQAMNSHEVDIRADIYSLGATFYFLLSGRPPYADGTVTQKLLWHQVKEPQHIREIRPEVQVALAGVLHRMMAKAPEQRYQTPLEVMDALMTWTQTPIPPPTEAELPQRSMAVQHLQASGSPSSSGAPRSDIRKPKLTVGVNGTGSRGLAPETTASGSPSSHTTLKPPATSPGRFPNRTVLAVGGLVFAVGIGIGVWAITHSTPTPPPSNGGSAQPPPPVPIPVPPPKPLVKTVPPEEAGKFLNQECTIRMQVRYIGADTGRFYLNSEENFRTDTNFAVVLDRADAEKFNLMELQDVRKRYQGKTVDVKGIVTEFKGKPQMRVKEHAQLQIVEGEK
jgi:serine/threonine protein kinase